MSPYLAATLGAIAGVGYFQAGESHIPKGSNCSYLAAPITDGLAWAAGFVLVAQGVRTNEPTPAFIGAAIAAVHAAQYLTHKAK